MAAKTSSKKSSAKTPAKKAAVKVKDLPTKKNPRGGSTDHPPKSGGRKSDY